MAIPFSQLNTFTLTHVVPKVVDNIYNSNILLKVLLQEKVRKWPGGTAIEFPVQYAKNTSLGFYGAAASLTTTAVEEFTKAAFSPVRANVGISLEGLDIAMNSGSAKVLSLVDQKMKAAEKALKDYFGDALYGTTPSNTWAGLQSICAAGDTTYGGVLGGPTGDATEWSSSSFYSGRANGPDSTTTTLTRTVMQKNYNACALDNDKPDILVTTPDIWAAIAATIIEPNMRYVNTNKGDIGFENYKYRKAYVYADDKCAAGDLWTLNSEHLFFYVIPSMNFKFIPWDKAVNSDVHVAHIRWYGTMCSDERRKQGWMSAITTVTA